MIVGATFGSLKTGAAGIFEKVYDETKEGDTVNYSDIQMAPSGTYLHIRSGWNISTGAYLGQAIELWTTPDEKVFASQNPVSISAASGGTAGVSGSFSPGKFRWRCSNANYRIRIVQIRVK